ncbi:MAG TPA: GNAT family N-acetyltransferase [Longimicrobiales bacterium]|nr:GNAT family N-acetyltransferase [Longimicrobiales bacterium]
MMAASRIAFPATPPAMPARDRLVLALGDGAAPDPDPAAEYAPIVLIRPAQPADVAEMMPILDGFAAQGLLLPRKPEDVLRTIDDFFVAVDPTGVVGCAGLRVYSPVLAEVVGVAVAERCQGRGIGRHLVETVVDEAMRLGIRRVFALTVQLEFFKKLGFSPTSVAEFPEKIERDCAGCARRSACIEVAVVRSLHGDPA